jgi:hypothetical protein
VQKSCPGDRARIINDQNSILPGRPLDDRRCIFEIASFTFWEGAAQGILSGVKKSSLAAWKNYRANDRFLKFKLIL